MSPAVDWDGLAREIAQATGEAFTIRGHGDVGGGCINRATKLQGDRRAYFVKHNRGECREMFEAEAVGLQELRRCADVRVPEPVLCTVLDDTSYLVLEFIELRPLSGAAASALGEGLAALHRLTAAKHGWKRANFIGTTPQANEPDPSWLNFWREQRLGCQLHLAAQRDARFRAAADALLAKLDQLLRGHEPAPSLLHGDLWGGNAAMDARGRPVIFDPAAYYGDRETDIAMMELFGFEAAALAAYRAAWPLDPGYAELRRDLYQLYHILNHFNLFGGHYGAQALSCMQRLLRAA